MSVTLNPVTMEHISDGGNCEGTDVTSSGSYDPYANPVSSPQGEVRTVYSTTPPEPTVGYRPQPHPAPYHTPQPTSAPAPYHTAPYPTPPSAPFPSNGERLMNLETEAARDKSVLDLQTQYIATLFGSLQRILTRADIRIDNRIIPQQVDTYLDIMTSNMAYSDRVYQTTQRIAKTTGLASEDDLVARLGQFADLQAQVRRLEAERNAHASEIHQARLVQKAQADIIEDSKRKQGDLDRMTREVATLRSELSARSSEVTAAMQQLEEKQRTFQTEKYDLVSTIKQLKGENAQLSTDLQTHSTVSERQLSHEMIPQMLSKLSTDAYDTNISICEIKILVENIQDQISNSQCFRV